MRRDPLFAGDILEHLEIAGIDSFTAAQVTIKGRIKTVPVKQWRIAREFRRRLKKAFDAQGIEVS